MIPQRPNSSGGFTFIETIIVLSIISVLLLFCLPFQSSLFNHHEEEKFLKLFSIDVLYIQQSAMANRENYRLFIYPSEHKYEIRESGTGKIHVQRTVPSNWQIDLHSLILPITFSENGNIQRPGTFVLYSDNFRYRITFPFGKGRFYVSKTKI